MTAARIAELAVAVLLLGGGILLYRQKPKDGNSYGNQGAVILIVVSVIVGIHALGGLDYHPSPAEADMLQDRGQ